MHLDVMNQISVLATLDSDSLYYGGTLVHTYPNNNVFCGEFKISAHHFIYSKE